MAIQVHRRILWRQLPILVILFVAVLFWLGYYLEGILLDASAAASRRSNLLVVTAIKGSMRAERSHEVWSRVVDRIPYEGDTSIEIVDARGKILFSTDAGRRGMTWLPSDPVCLTCHRGGQQRGYTETALVEDPDDQRYQVFAAPLRNSRDCRTCHINGAEKLGMVLVRQSVAPINSQVKAVLLALTLAGSLALVLTFLTTRLMLERHLGRPMKKLVEGARAIGAGNLDYRIELHEQTELKLLGDALNESACRLSQTMQSLRRQRDDAQTLYRLVDQLSRGVMPGERRKRAVELAGELLRSDCVLVRALAASEEPHHSLALVSYRDGEVVELPMTDSGEADHAPPFYSCDLVQRWLHGKLDGVTEIQADGTMAHPLHRSGRRLGLLLRPADPSETEANARDPEMVQALCRHVAIALELSDLQREMLQEERLAVLGETVAGLAHWLKNTLNGLRAGQYVVDRAVDLGDLAKLEKGWRVMKKSIGQVEKLTHDVLYCAKDRGPTLAPVDPNEIVCAVVDLMEARAVEHGIRLVKEVEGGLGMTSLDADRIQRALLNLVTNAFDACVESDGGDRVTVRSAASEDGIVLSVEDNGIGMPEPVKQRVFSRFFSTKGSQGTGLGLMVVKKIVEEHGGRVEVTSRLGSGSIFSIHLPRRADSGTQRG